MRLRLLLSIAFTVVGCFAMFAPVAQFPELAAEAGLTPSLVGVFSGVEFGFGVVSSLTGPALVERYGALWTCRASMALTALGLCVAAFATPTAIFLSAAVLGYGYGLLNPASATLLAGRAPQRRRALVFSLKQAAVPAGALLAGATVPGLTQWGGTGPALLVVGAVCLVMIGLSRPMRDGFVFDPDRPRSRAVELPWTPLRGNPQAFTFALLAMLFTANQNGWSSTAVTHFNTYVGLSLVEAGLVLAIAQAAGIAGRILWGLAADAVGDSRLVLTGLTLTMAAGTVATALAAPGWSAPTLFVIAAVVGGAAIGWHGVYLSEVTRVTPPERVARVVGATSCFAFAGGLVGPLIYSAVDAVTGSPSFAFLAIAACPLPAIYLLYAVRGARP